MHWFLHVFQFHRLRFVQCYFTHSVSGILLFCWSEAVINCMCIVPNVSKFHKNWKRVDYFLYFVIVCAVSLHIIVVFMQIVVKYSFVKICFFQAFLWLLILMITWLCACCCSSSYSYWQILLPESLAVTAIIWIMCHLDMCIAYLYFFCIIDHFILYLWIVRQHHRKHHLWQKKVRPALVCHTCALC